jgi:glycosyltransferase involved in cell wall biosynthesis
VPSGKSQAVRVVILAAAIGTTSGGAGQYERQVLPLLLPLLKAAGYRVTVLLCGDANLQLPAGLATVIRSPQAASRKISRILLEEMWPSFVTWGTDIFLSMDSRFPLSPLWARKKLVVVHDVQILRHLATPAQYPIDAPWASLKYFSLGMSKALRTADTIITDSAFTANELVSFAGVADDRICVIPCGIDHERFHPPGDNSRIEEVRSRYHLPAAFYLFVGQPSKQKNLALVVESYASGSLPGELRLPVVVTWNLRRSSLFEDTLARIEQTGLSSLFQFAGYFRDEDLPLVYAAARALLYPSRYEGFGLPPLESMACGTPVVCSNCTSLPEVVGNATLLIDPDQPESLVEAVRKVNNESARRDLIKKGLERAQAFSWQSTAKQVAHQILHVRESTSGAQA